MHSRACRAIWIRALVAGSALSLAFAAARPSSVALAQAQGQTEEWTALDSRVNELYSRGDLQQALSVAHTALDAARTPAQSARSLDRLGFLTYTAGNLPEGETLLRRSLEIRQAAFGVDSLEYAETANDLAMLLRDLRKGDEARSLAERAVMNRERILGAQALPLAESLNTLATVQALVSGNYVEGVALFERALAIHESQPSSERETEEYGTLCINLAGTYQRIGKFEAAEATFRKGLEALRVKPGTGHPAYSTSLVVYAGLEVDLGHFSEAERLYDEGGRLIAQQLGERHPFYASFLNNRGFFHQTVGNRAAAEADYQRSLEIKRALYGPQSPLAVSTLRNLAHLTYQHDRRRGGQLLLEAVDAYASMPSAPAFDYTSVLVGLARAQRERGAVDEARATATRAVATSRTGLGDRHPLYAAAVRELGLALEAAGDMDAAEHQLRDAVAVAEQGHGPQHPDVAGFLDALGDFYVARRNYAAAQPLYARSLDIQDRFLAGVLQIGSEEAKAASMATLGDPVPRLLAFQAAARDLPEARALAFEAVTRRKGRVLDQIRTWQQQVDTVASERVRSDARVWNAVVDCRTSLVVALGYRDIKPGLAGSCGLAGTDLEGRYERLLADLRSRWTPDLGASAVRAVAVLQERADALESALNREVVGHQAQSRATVDELRRRLAPGEALIEIAATNTAASGEPPSLRYSAFVLRSSGTIEWADLGSAAPIEASVRDLLESARDWSISVSQHDAAAARASAQTASDAMAVLSRRVWRPIAPLVDSKSITRLRIAPDGLLNLVPFEALSDGRQLIDRFTISYVPAGRDLALATPSMPLSPPVVVVSPGVSRTPGAVQASISSFRTSELGRLDAADAEAADVRRFVPGASVLSGDAATEHRVKELHHPSLLHIVGHGVVRASEPCTSGPCVSGALAPSTQAMTLAAIVLEEAYGRGRTSTDDGLLTALELRQVDLRGTEMLVLSQCQMASGLASVGEGVYGMRRAADIAGVRSLVAPLWNVEDSVQRRLMRGLYEGLASGASRADALRQAKLAVRRTAATSSFLYWAPVILSGAPEPVPASVFRH